MIYITGDTHGPEGIKRLAGHEALQELCGDDFLIILGDFGLISDSPTDAEKSCLEWLSRQKYTTLVIDGNHEDFGALYSLPVQAFLGGQASRLHDSVWWLRRGEVYEIDGCRCFTLGGAASIDKEYRDPGKNWWEQETPSEQEFHNALHNLEKNSWAVDFVLTHTCPKSVRKALPKTNFKDEEQALRIYESPDAANDMLESINERLSFRRWFFGHFHMDLEIASPNGNEQKFSALYRRIIKLSDA